MSDTKTGSARINIARADSSIWVADELLNAIRTDEQNQKWGMFRLVPPADGHPHHTACLLVMPDPHPVQCFTGWLLYVTGSNHEVIYRIGEYLHEPNAWQAVWPD